jgi:hypothetical protein
MQFPPASRNRPINPAARSYVVGVKARVAVPSPMTETGFSSWATLTYRISLVYSNSGNGACIIAS